MSMQKKDPILFDFESGTFEGWTQSGGLAFGTRPVETPIDCWPKLATWQQSYRFTGWQGKFLVVENMWHSEKHHWARPATVPNGSLISPPFTITHNYLKFYIAGMVHPGVRVYLTVDETEVRSIHGNNAFDLRLRGWNVEEFFGKEGRIILEIKSEEKCMIRLDHFHLSDTPPPEEEIYEPKHERDSRVMRIGLYQRIINSDGIGSGYFHHGCMVFGHDQRWHFYAEESKHKEGYWPEHHDSIYHASAENLNGPWSSLEKVMERNALSGEKWLWRPSVVFHNGQYFMFYLASGEVEGEGGTFAVHLAVSRDGIQWMRHDCKPLLESAKELSNVYVTKIQGQWVMYYSAEAHSLEKPPQVIYCRVSENLYHWSEERVVGSNISCGDGWGGGNIVVFQRGQFFYLIARRKISQYGRTRFLFSEVWRSKDPFHWDYVKDSQGILDVWGSNPVVRDKDGSWHIIHCHMHSRGAWIAPLKFPDGMEDGISSISAPGP